MRLTSALAALAALLVPMTAPLAAQAATYYVAARGTSLTCPADGTQACPFATINAAFSSGKLVGGDTVLLMDGDHNGFRISQSFTSPVTIQSQNASNARIASALFDASARNITIKNAKLWLDDADPYTGSVIGTFPGASYLTFDGLELRARQGSTDYLTWNDAKWSVSGASAFILDGDHLTVRNSTIRGVVNGIMVTGTTILVENNLVDGFIQDGMDGNCSDCTFRGNVVKNAVETNFGYHSDGFQSVAPNGLITGLVFENNTIINWTYDPASPQKAGLQGISLFEGWYDNLVIRNNLVVTDMGHGISVYGTRNAKILNNTVVNSFGLPGNYPWIMVTTLRDGSPSKNVMVANNLAMSLGVPADPVNNVIATSNSIILDPKTVFTNVAAYDFRPTATSGFIDTGDVANAAPTDILGAARPSGAGPDRGAYEVGGTSSSSSGTTTTTTGSGTSSTSTTSGGTTTSGTTGTTTDGTTTTTGGTGGTTTTTTGGTTTTTTGGTTTTTGGTTTTTSGGTTTTTSGGGPKFLKPPKKR